MRSRFFKAFVFLILASNAHAVDPEAAGKDIADEALSAYGSSSGMNERMVRPLTSNLTPMKTLDNKRSFTSQLTCPSSHSFVSVSAYADSSTADVTVTVAQDTDMDGLQDYAYAAPSPISGVCADGVISCSPGTFLNCVYYKWGGNGSTVSLEKISNIKSLSACYCINASCGGLSLSNIPHLLKDLAGGVVGVLQNISPRYSVSNVQTEGNTITYYGQDTENCKGLLKTGNTGLAGYYRNPSALDAAVESNIASESSDVDSAYYQMTTSSASTSVVKEFSNCAVTAVVTATPQTVTTSGGGSGAACADYFMFARVDKAADGYLFRYIDSGSGGIANEPHKNCAHTGGGSLEGWHKIVLADPGAPSNTLVDFQFCVTPSGSACSFTPACINYLGISNTVALCAASGAQNFSFDYTYTFNVYQDQLKENISDTCKSYKDNPDCSLQEEIIDGVVTVTKGMVTGAVPAPSCHTVTGSAGNTVCRDWWEREMTYYCKTGDKYDVEDLVEKKSVVWETADLSGSTLSYTDNRQQKDGTFSKVSNSIELSGRWPSGECIKACKVRKPVETTRVGTQGPSTGYLSSNGFFEISYMQCPENFITCADFLSPGEEIMDDCSCVDGLNEAYSAMKALEAASKDIICGKIR